MLSSHRALLHGIPLKNSYFIKGYFMKKILRNALITYICITSNSLMAQISAYSLINPAQEKVRIILKQIEATYNWHDQIYAARERYYLSGIACDYLHRQKNKCKTHKECFALIEKLETIAEKLHFLDLSQIEFERIQCAAQPLIELPLFAAKPPACIIA
jgi:hypothetical protein